MSSGPISTKRYKVPEAEYWLTAFHRLDETLVGEWPLADFSLEELTQMFDPPEHDRLMFDQYKVSREHAQHLGSAVGERLDLDRFDYFVGARATE